MRDVSSEDSSDTAYMGHNLGAHGIQGRKTLLDRRGGGSSGEQGVEDRGEVTDSLWIGLYTHALEGWRRYIKVHLGLGDSTIYGYLH